MPPTCPYQALHHHKSFPWYKRLVVGVGGCRGKRKSLLKVKVHYLSKTRGTIILQKKGDLGKCLIMASQSSVIVHVTFCPSITFIQLTGHESQPASQTACQLSLLARQADRQTDNWIETQTLTDWLTARQRIRQAGRQRN